MKALLVVVWLGVLWLAGLIWMASGTVAVPESRVAAEASLDLWPGQDQALTDERPEAADEVSPEPVAQPMAQSADAVVPVVRGPMTPPAASATPADTTPTAASASAPKQQDALAAAAQAKIDKLRALQAARAEAGAAVVAQEAAPAAKAVAPALRVVPGTCSRLGLFPDANWATRVVGLLLPGEVPSGVRWRILPVQGKGYYLVVRGLSVEALSERLESRRPTLGKLVSTSVRPESCA